MKEGLFFRRADGAEIPVKEVEGLTGNGILILITETFLRPEDMEKMQRSIEERIGDGTREIHENAVAHGWWDEERSFPEIIALCHSELSEALEEYRSGRPNEWYACEECFGDGKPCDPEDQYDCANYSFKEKCEHRSKKPEGIDIDRIISAKHEYNKSRPYRHGGKKC